MQIGKVHYSIINCSARKALTFACKAALPGLFELSGVVLYLHWNGDYARAHGMTGNDRVSVACSV